MFIEKRDNGDFYRAVGTECGGDGGSRLEDRRDAMLRV